MINKLPRLTT